MIKLGHWVYYDPVNKLVCFDYRKSRGSTQKFPERFYGLPAKRWI